MHARFPIDATTSIQLAPNQDDLGGTIRLSNDPAVLDLEAADASDLRRVGAALFAAADQLDGKHSTHG